MVGSVKTFKMEQLSLFGATTPPPKKVALSRPQKKMKRQFTRNATRRSQPNALTADIYRYGRTVYVRVWFVNAPLHNGEFKFRLKGNNGVKSFYPGCQMTNYKGFRCNATYLYGNGAHFKVDGIRRAEQVILDILALNGFGSGCPELHRYVNRYSARCLCISDTVYPKLQML